jgi:hypothetical protein
MSDDNDSIDGSIENNRMIIEDIDYFYRFSQLYAICNYIVTIENYDKIVDIREKEKILDVFIEENIEWLEDHKFLDSNISISEIKEVFEPLVKHNILDDIYYIDVNDLNTSIQKITMSIVDSVLNDLVDSGDMKLAWSTQENDFVFIPAIEEDKKQKRKKTK